LFLKRLHFSLKYIPKPFRFSGVLAKVIFFFKKAKSSTIAFVMVLFFNAFKGKKTSQKIERLCGLGICKNILTKETFVIPAKAGIYIEFGLDSCLRRNDNSI